MKDPVRHVPNPPGPPRCLRAMRLAMADLRKALEKLEAAHGELMAHWAGGGRPAEPSKPCGEDTAEPYGWE